MKASCLAVLGSLTIVPKVGSPVSRQCCQHLYISAAVMTESFNVTIYGHRVQTVEGLRVAGVSYIVLAAM